MYSEQELQDKNEQVAYMESQGWAFMSIFRLVLWEIV